MEIRLKIPIRELLCHGCAGTYGQRHLQELYRIFYAIARRLVRRKMISGRLPSDTIGLSEADITHDCIVEMFKVGKSGELSEICKYFSYQRLSIEDNDEEILLIHLRRLVFTFVNDNIFRLYNDVDPALGKIIRNIKIAIPYQGRFKLMNRFDEQYLELAPGRKPNSCDDVDADFIQHEIFEIMKTEIEIPRILDRFATALEEQDIFQRRVGLIDLAITIKNSFKHHAQRTDGSVWIEDRLQAGETERLIERTCAELGEEMKPKYVKKNKATHETFLKYIDVIKKALRSEFIDGTDGQISYFDHCRDFFPEITKKEYYEKHRVIIEYLGKLSKKRVRAGMKEIL